MIAEPAQYTPDAIAAASRKWRAEGFKIVFTNGCFDLIHPGHIRYFQEARSLGDILVVGVNSDESVRLLKGPGRPILHLQERMETLLSLRWVDAVVPFSEPTPLKLIQAVNPHFLVKGGDWPVEKIEGRKFVEENGGKVLSLPFHQGLSTSGIIQRILRSNN